jgi:hypothetical protein
MLRDGPAVHGQRLHQVLHRALEHVEFNVSTFNGITTAPRTTRLSLLPQHHIFCPTDRTGLVCTPVYIYYTRKHVPLTVCTKTAVIHSRYTHTHIICWYFCTGYTVVSDGRSSSKLFYFDFITILIILLLVLLMLLFVRLIDTSYLFTMSVHVRTAMFYYYFLFRIFTSSRGRHVVTARGLWFNNETLPLCIDCIIVIQLRGQGYEIDRCA